MAYNAFKAQQWSKYQMLMLISTLMGVAFMVLQYEGWLDLYASGVDLRANVGGSFFYLITGAHAAHVLGVSPFWVLPACLLIHFL